MRVKDWHQKKRHYTINKTAMTVLQELMSEFEEYQRESKKDSITIEKLIEVITQEFLLKEKEQIIDTAIEFSMHGLEMATRNAEEYYDSL